MGLGASAFVEVCGSRVFGRSNEFPKMDMPAMLGVESFLFLTTMCPSPSTFYATSLGLSSCYAACGDVQS